MLFRQNKGSMQPALAITMGLLIVLFMVGADLFRLYMLRQSLLNYAKNIAAYGLAQGKLAAASPCDSGVTACSQIQSDAAMSAMTYVSNDYASLSKICKGCTLGTTDLYVHSSQATEISCVPIGETATDYQFKDLTTSCAGGLNWVTTQPATGVYLAATFNSSLPFWTKTTTIRVFAPAYLRTGIPMGDEALPWLR